MARFVYICDTHLGADPMGYHPQPEYAQRLPELFDLLSDWIRADGDIDFILHGGDLIDETRGAFLAQAKTLVHALPVPLHLCLGNHDLTVPDALAQWQDTSLPVLPEGQPCYTLTPPGCRIHVVPNQWGTEPWYWNQDQEVAIRPSDLEQLEHRLAEDTELPHIIATHAPTRALPPEQTGLDAPHHGSAPEFMDLFTQLGQDHKHLRLVLSAHSHMNLHVHEQQLHHVGCSALVETPFEFKLIDLSPEGLRIDTLSLREQVSWTAAYDTDLAYVQGRPCDRHIDERFA